MGLSGSHVHALHRLLMTVASCCGMRAHPPGVCPALQGAASHVLRQLAQLTGHLLMAIPLDPRLRLCQSLLDVSGRAPARQLHASLSWDCHKVHSQLVAHAQAPHALCPGPGVLQALWIGLGRTWCRAVHRYAHTLVLPCHSLHPPRHDPCNAPCSTHCCIHPTAV